MHDARESTKRGEKENGTELGDRDRKRRRNIINRVCVDLDQQDNNQEAERGAQDARG